MCLLTGEATMSDPFIVQAKSKIKIATQLLHLTVKPTMMYKVKVLFNNVHQAFKMSFFEMTFNN